MLLIEWMWYSNLQKANSGDKNMCKERKWCLQEITNEVSDVNKLERFPLSRSEQGRIITLLI